MNKGWKKVFAISLAATAMAKPAGTGLSVVNIKMKTVSCVFA